MTFDEKINKIFEGLNQSAIAYDQQKTGNRNYVKYRPKDAPLNISYQKGNLPTVQASKMGAPYSTNVGPISDEEKEKKKKKLKKKKKSL